MSYIVNRGKQNCSRVGPGPTAWVEGRVPHSEPAAAAGYLEGGEAALHDVDVLGHGVQLHPDVGARLVHQIDGLCPAAPGPSSRLLASILQAIQASGGTLPARHPAVAAAVQAFLPVMRRALSVTACGILTD